MQRYICIELLLLCAKSVPVVGRQLCTDDAPAEPHLRLDVGKQCLIIPEFSADITAPNLSSFFFLSKIL